VKKVFVALATLVLIFVACSQAKAAAITAPIFSPLRAAIAVGADYAFYSGSQAPVFPVKKEWQVGIFGSYKLTPTLSLVGGTRLAVDSKQFDSKVGLRLLVWDGNK
jgi:hypothetical protein